MAFKINEEFKKKFNERKERQELEKLKSKYEDDKDSESESESEDEVAQVISDKFEEDFFKTLNAIRSKDPKIYDQNVEFFGQYGDDKKPSRNKTKSLRVRNYEGAHILEMEGEQAEEEVTIKFEEEIVPKNTEEKELAKSFLDTLKKGQKVGVNTAIVEEVEGEKEPVKKISGAHEIKQEEKGEEENVMEQLDDDKESDNKDGFLIDYFKKMKYLFESEATEDDLGDVSSDEKEVEKGELFEHKYNFRFEDPDEDFIKSYPRTIADSVRMQVNKRAEKRKDVEARKKQEKAKKKEELRTLRKLKKKEEMKKLKKLKKISGAEMNLKDINLEEDFDAEKHDNMMKKYFGKGYYDEYDNEDVTQIDENILDSGDEYEDWDNWTGCHPQDSEIKNCGEEDYTQNKEQTSKRKKKDKESKKLRKSKFAEMLEKNQSKPLFDPTKETFDEYLDKYYNLDFEDLIDGETCRFRYRKVFPADYGLTTDEILAAPDQELNAWVSLKKMTEMKTEEEEALYEKGIKQKLKKKKKILKSLFEKSEQESTKPPENDKQGDINTTNQNNESNHKDTTKTKGKKRKWNGEEQGLSEDRLEGYNINPKKFKYMYLPMIKEEKKLKK